MLLLLLFLLLLFIISGPQGNLIWGDSHSSGKQAQGQRGVKCLGTHSKDRDSQDPDSSPSEKVVLAISICRPPWKQHPKYSPSQVTIWKCLWVFSPVIPMGSYAKGHEISVLTLQLPRGVLGPYVLLKSYRVVLGLFGNEKIFLFCLLNAFLSIIFFT